jgi:hypothetical protein
MKRQPLKPGMLCYVHNPIPASELHGRFVITVRPSLPGDSLRLPNGDRLVRTGAEPAWWVKSAVEGDMLPLRGWPMRERAVYARILRPILPPEDSDITTTTKEKELDHAK